MVDYDFKALWGVRLLKQYPHLLLKYNHFGETEFNVLDLAGFLSKNANYEKI